VAIGLQSCSIIQPPGLAGEVEIVIAPHARRIFSLRSSPDLGVIVKDGAPHQVVSDGRRRLVPRDAIIFRPPGCVWSMAEAFAGFVSINIGPRQLPDDATYGPMSFCEPAAIPDLGRLIAVLRRPASLLQCTQAVASIHELLVANGFAGVIQSRAVDAPSTDVYRVKEFLSTPESYACTLDDVARAANLNKFVLLRQFKRIVGISPHAFHLQMRISKARALLARGRQPSEVAAETGWADQSHFGRHFKRTTGLSPGKYARTVRSSTAVHRDQHSGSGGIELMDSVHVARDHQGSGQAGVQPPAIVPRAQDTLNSAARVTWRPICGRRH
jgi:AraC-like DNA-binding protein